MATYTTLTQHRIGNKTGKGFTLIELLIVLAIVVVLACVSYPVYANHVLKTNRYHAVVRMMEIASNLEQYHATYDTYEGAETSVLPPYDNNSHYQFQLTGLSESQYILEAIPLGFQQKDTRCGIILLDQAGQKKISGTGNPEDCF